MKWQIRFLKNALFGLLPCSEVIRKVRRIIKPPCCAIDEWSIEEGLRQVEMLLSVDCTIDGKVLMEIGTGWRPVIPLIFYLLNPKKIILVDMQRLSDDRLVFETARSLLEYKYLIAKRLNLSVNLIEEKLTKEIRFSSGSVLEKQSIQYIAPCDITKAEFSDKSIDIIISRQVFEHTKPETLVSILSICKRILKDDGVMCHVIDNSDHWEHEDSTISRLNFLKFDDRFFKLISSFNPLDYQNRLRHFEYLELFTDAGFTIDYAKADVNIKALEDLKLIKVCKRYRHVPYEELARLTSYIVASK